MYICYVEGGGREAQRRNSKRAKRDGPSAGDLNLNFCETIKT